MHKLAVDRFPRGVVLKLAFALALLLAVAMRLAPIVADFPFGDGGLFWVMASELRANGLVPPETTAFNDAGIPWMYPPIGLYLVALLGGGLEWFRIAPAIFAVATLPAMWLLARALTNDRAALAATAAYGLTLPAYYGLVTGGGMTRSPGLLLALLAMWAVVTGRVVPAGILGGLVILTHPMAAFYGGAGAAALWVTRGAPKPMFWAAGIAVGIGAVWFVPMAGRHGIDSLLASVGSREVSLVENFVTLLAATVNPPNLAFTIGMVGIVLAVRQRRWDLLLWLGVTLLGGAVVDRWAVIPMAVLAGLAIDAALESWPSLRAVALASVAIVTAVTGVQFAQPPRPISAQERAVATWAAANTPQEATFAVIGYNADGGMVEWFPALSGRVNVTTWQGTEWVAGAQDRRREATNAANCRATDCLPDADYYVLRPGCCDDLARQMEVVTEAVYRAGNR